MRSMYSERVVRESGITCYQYHAVNQNFAIKTEMCRRCKKAQNIYHVARYCSWLKLCYMDLMIQN